MFRLLSVLIGVFIGLTPASAQAAQTEQPARAAPAQVAPSASSPAPAPAKPDTAQAVEAFLTVRSWLQQGHVPPPNAGTPASTATQPPSAAGVILRLRGRTVGMGRAIAPTAQPLHEAARQAFAAARQDAAVQAMGEGALAQLTLELELGGAPLPLVGTTFAEVLTPLQPAAQGLALRSGDTWAYMPASIVLARGMAEPLSRSLLAMVTELHLPHRDLPELRVGASTAVYAVPCTRLRQASPEGMPLPLARLTPPLAWEPLTDQQLTDLGMRIAAHLQSALARRDAATAPSIPQQGTDLLKELGLPGTYEALADEELEPVANPADQALCAYALARASKCAKWPEEARKNARATALRILHSLQQVKEGEQDPLESPHAAPLMLLAIETLGAQEFAAHDAFLKSLRTRTVALLEPGPSQAMALAAAALCAANGTTLIAQTQLESALAAAWVALKPATVLTAAPWLLTAERALGERTAQMDLTDQMDILFASYKLLEASQAALARQPNLSPDDWGAYPTTESGTRRATAQSARAMLFVALVMGTEALSAQKIDDIHQAKRSLRMAARFLAQLQVGESLEYALRSPERARGAIMTAPFDATIAPAAQGWALLAVVEAQ